MPTSNLLSSRLSSATRTGAGVLNPGNTYFYREDSGYAVDLARLSDGQLGPVGGYQAFSVMPNQVSLTFNLDLSVRPAGYDIATIKTYASWDSGRDGQAYAVEYSTAANPGQFALLATVSRFDNTDFPTVPNYGYDMDQYMASYYMSMANALMSTDPMMASMYMSMASMYQSSSPFTENTNESSTMVRLTDTSGVLASGVAALRFNFSGVENGGTAFREFVVEGVAVAAPTTVSGLVTDLTSFNVGGVVTFEGGRFAPLSSSSLPNIRIASGHVGTFDAASADIVGSGSVVIDGQSLTLAGSATSTINLSGGVSGAGGLINTGGNNVVWGNYTGATVVSGGTLVNVGASQSASNQIAAGATLEFNVTTGTAASGTTVFSGAGTLLKTGSGRLMWGTTAATFGFGSGALIRVAEGILVGGSDWSEVWTDNRSDLQVDAGARFEGVEASVRVNRLSGTGVVATGLADPAYHGLTVGVDGGDSSFAGTIVDTDSVGGAVGRLHKVGAGEMVLTGASTYSGGTTLHAGSLRAGNGAALGTGTITLIAGVLSADGAVARTLTNAVFVGGDVTLGDVVKSGALTLSGSVNLGAGATVTFASDVILTGGVTSAGILTKAGAGILSLSGTAVVSSSVVVDAGLLTNNGSISGPVSVAAGGTLGGTGTLAGPLNVAGVLAPGNSPGILEQAAGPATFAAGSSFLAELGGTVAGDGDGFHDQFFVQNGPASLSAAGAGVRLDVAGWVEADGTTVFQPGRADVFTLLRASGGISGGFADLTNQDYSTWVIYDNRSDPSHQFGNLYGTGLTGGQSFADWGAGANRSSLAGALWLAAVTPSDSSTNANPAGFIDGDTAAGRLAIALMTTPSPDATLDAWSSETFFGASDYVLTAMRSVTDAAAGQSSFVKEGAWTLGAGYARADATFTGGSAVAFDRPLRSGSGFVVVSRDLGASGRMGFFVAQNSGHTQTQTTRSDYEGVLFGLNGSYRFAGAFPVTLRAAATRARLEFDSRRTVATAVSGNGGAVSSSEVARASDVALRGWGLQASAEVRAYAHGAFTVSPLIGYVSGRSTVEAFAEAGADASLAVSAFDTRSSRGLAGVSLGWQAREDVTLTLLATMEHESGRDDSVVAGLGGQSFVATDAVSDGSISNLGVGASVRLTPTATLSVGAEFRESGETHEDLRVNASVSWRF